MAITTNVYNYKAEEVGTIALPEKIFKVKKNGDLLNQALVTYLANQRQVLAHTKTKGEVRGGGKKPWKQKGTGRARAGSSRSPLWIGGGVTFGPRNERNFKKKINRKMNQRAIFMVLTDRFNDSSLAILENLEMTEYKTKSFNEMLKQLENKIFKVDAKKEKRSVLLINDKNTEQTKVSGRNLSGVELINLDNINIFDVLKYKKIVLTQNAVKILEERYNS
jgi:large subunit ribosomal protein L4